MIDLHLSIPLKKFRSYAQSSPFLHVQIKAYLSLILGCIDRCINFFLSSQEPGTHNVSSTEASAPNSGSKKNGIHTEPQVIRIYLGSD
jgi:hypothetical protein